jgi:hypothetical protein
MGWVSGGIEASGTTWNTARLADHERTQNRTLLLQMAMTVYAAVNVKSELAVGLR